MLQGVRVGGEVGDPDRGGGQLEIDGGLVVLRRTQVNTHGVFRTLHLAHLDTARIAPMKDIASESPPV